MVTLLLNCSSLTWAFFFGLILFAATPQAAEPPRLSLSTRLDGTGRQVDAEERRMLRVEWRAGAGRVEEERIVVSMLTRIAHIEATTQELFRLIEAMPAASRTATGDLPSELAPPVASNDAATDLVPQSVRIAAVALLIGLALVLTLRVKRQRPVMPDLAEPTMPPDAPPSPTPKLNSLRARGQRASVRSTPMDQVIAQAQQATAPPAAEPTREKSAPAEQITSDRAAPSGTREIDQTLELAEIMLSMGLSSSASNALVQHIERNPRQALAHWLKLLDIYRRDGHRADFERAARELRQNFNIRADDWMGQNKTARSLEEFERIVTHVAALCQRPAELTEYLTHLLEDNREGIRTGFPQPVAEDIMLLIAVMRGHLDPPSDTQTAAETTPEAILAAATEAPPLSPVT